MGMCWASGWHLLHLVLLHRHADGAGAIPGKVAQGMPDPPLDPHPHYCLGKIDLAHFVLVVMPRRMAHWDLPPLRVGSPSGHGGGWPLM